MPGPATYDPDYDLKRHRKRQPEVTRGPSDISPEAARDLIDANDEEGDA